MSYSTYNDIKNDISNKIEFQGSSSRGVILESGNYAVYSYSTLMLEVNENDEVVYFNDSYYSSTTSRLQNIIKSIYTLGGNR